MYQGRLGWIGLGWEWMETRLRLSKQGYTVLATPRTPLNARS